MIFKGGKNRAQACTLAMLLRCCLISYFELRFGRLSFPFGSISRTKPAHYQAA
jgi:hypothetical protein